MPPRLATLWGRRLTPPPSTPLAHADTHLTFDCLASIVDGVTANPTTNQRPAPRATLRDVGRLANVDPSIASRVLAGDERRVREETRLRIVAAAEQLGWRPHQAARSLRTGRTSTIAVLIPSLHNPAYGAMIRGAQRAAAAADHVVVFADTDDEARTAGQELERLSQYVDGIVVASASRTQLTARSLEHVPVPVVLLNRRGVRGLPAVVGKDEVGARLAARHLAQLGHRRVAILAGPEHLDTAQRRTRAFVTECAKLGLPDATQLSAPLRVEDAAAVFAAHLRRQGSVTAVFGAALTSALGSLSAARACGVDVPAELSVVGFDDAEVAELITPPLTTVRMPHEQMGARAVTLLLAALSGEDVPTTTVLEDEPVLVVRGTTAPPAARARRATP